MPHPYDNLRAENLRGKHSIKWSKYAEDVLPLWVADMDFPLAEPILAALKDRLGRNIGYGPFEGQPELLEATAERQYRQHGWRVSPEQLWLISGVVPGLYAAVHALSMRDEHVLTQAPIYPPFIGAIRDSGRQPAFNPLVDTSRGFEIDFEQLERQITPDTRLLMLCSPHNPTGRVWRRGELERLAELVLKHRLWVVSDELHAELRYGSKHIPFASLDRDVSMRTVTLTGPCKSFNFAGLGAGVAISENPSLLKAMRQASAGFLRAPNVMSQAAMLAAYRQGEAWFRETLAYLQGNRDRVAGFVRERLPEVHFHTPESTYLAWFDLRGTSISERAFQTVLEEGRLALNDGASFGPGGEGFLRLNFATGRNILDEALERLAGVLVRHRTV